MNTALLGKVCPLIYSSDYHVWYLQTFLYKVGTGYEYDGNVFVAWVLQVRRAEVVTK